MKPNSISQLKITKFIYQVLKSLEKIVVPMAEMGVGYVFTSDTISTTVYVKI